MNISVYSIPNFIVGLYSLFLGTLIITKSKRNLLNILFFAYFVLIALWQFSFGIEYSCTNKNIALVFAKLAHVPIMCYAPLFYYICILITKKKNEIKFFIAIAIINFLLGAFLVSSSWYISGVKKHFWGYYAVAGPTMTIEIIVTLLIVTRAAYLLYLTYRYNTTNLSRNELNKIKYLTLAFSIFILSCFDFMQKYGVEIYPFGFIFVGIFLSIISYSILKHQLLDINIVFRKGLIYSILVTVIGIIYYVAAFLLEYIWRDIIGYKSLPLTIFIITLIVFLFQPLKNYIQRTIDKYFFHGTIEQIDEENIKLREELQETEKLKAVATLAAGMAHEIKNPLTSIKTFTEYIEEKGDDPIFRKKFHKIVGKEVDRINSTVKKLLEFSKPSDPHLKQTNIGELLDETLNLLNNDFIKHNIKLEKHYSSSPTIKIDPTQIKQVFLNIFLNAIDAMPDGGTITTRIKTVNDKLQITISDTGKGINKEDIKHIFDPFFTNKDEGTGLGLSVIYGIIEKHGGEINVGSALNKGTSFTITLPFK